jgi:glycosyltransferase involved in cell wall biosynthesis
VSDLYTGLSIDYIREQSPNIVHVQHEFGVFGRKIPPLYSFPRWVRKLRRKMPESHVVATAHTTIGPEFRYPLKGYLWQSPVRWVANNLMLPYLLRVWNEGTWGALDGVIVHSARHAETLREVCKTVHVIPHFVPKLANLSNHSRLSSIPDEPVILIFGFISRPKGHDIAVQAVARMKHRVRLVFAGTSRTKGDATFLEECLRLATKMGVRDRVIVTGHVPDDEILSIYRKAALTLAPFRESSGSGSLAFGLASGTPVLASDIQPNLEIVNREPGCLALFEAGNPEKCAERADQLLDSHSACESIVAAAKRYSESNSPSRIAGLHAAFYSGFL